MKTIFITWFFLLSSLLSLGNRPNSCSFSHRNCAGEHHPSPVDAHKTQYRDTIGHDIYIQLTPGSKDNSLELQKQIDAVDFNTGATNVHVHVNHGFFTFLHGILFHNWQQARGTYFPFTIDFEGDGTAASADGSGTIFYFPVNNTFWIGFQGAKGCKFHGITLQGKWHSTYKTSYEFYTGGGMGPLDFRNTNFDPAASIAIDPFGPSVPSDGGYPGTDAYGKPWSSYYRGAATGSTGCQIYDCKFIGTWIGIITSPNGQTPNAEAMHFYSLNFDVNNANPIVGCQDQEKMNEVGPDIIDWGATSTFIQIGTYGAHRPGHWDIHGVNIAGPVRLFIYDIQSGFYPTHIHDCFGETLGSIGPFSSGMGSSVERCTFDFANPVDAAFHYFNWQIIGNGVAYRDCNFRFYGLPSWPITINNQNGWNVMDNVGFTSVPVYNNYSGGGTMRFRDCFVNGILFSQISGKSVPIDSTAPGAAPKYTVTYSMDGKYNSATIQCVGNELQRVRPNTPLVAYDARDIQVGVAGVVTAVDRSSNTFKLSYIPPLIVSGQKYGLCLWKQNLTP